MNKEWNYDDGPMDLGRYCVIVLALDKSGSMTCNSEAVYEATVRFLEVLTEKNREALDFEYRIVLMTFDNEVHMLNADGIPLPPENVLELLDRGDYVCRGGTSLAEVFNHLDRLFSRREGGMLCHANKGDALPLTIFITDYMATDNQISYEEARSRLLSNRFYQKSARLCVFLGPEHKRSDAAELVGSESSVVVLEDDIVELLAPVVISSSIIMADATHIGDTRKTPGEIGLEQRERAADGTLAATNLSDEELERKLMELLKKPVQG